MILFLSIDTDAGYSSVRCLWIAYSWEDIVFSSAGGLVMLAD